MPKRRLVASTACTISLFFASAGCRSKPVPEPSDRPDAAACAGSLALMPMDGGQSTWRTWSVVGHPQGRVSITPNPPPTKPKRTIQEFELGPFVAHYTLFVTKGVPVSGQAEVLRRGCLGEPVRLPQTRPEDGSDFVLRAGPDGAYAVSLRSSASGSEQELFIGAIRRSSH